MIRKAIIAGVVFPFASAAAMAGGLNPPGAGAQMTGAMAMPSTTRAAAAATVLDQFAATPGGAARLVAAINAMPGTHVDGNMITTQPIAVGADTVVLSIDMASGVVSVLRTNGAVVAQIKANIDRSGIRASR